MIVPLCCSGLHSAVACRPPTASGSASQALSPCCPAGRAALRPAGHRKDDAGQGGRVRGAQVGQPHTLHQRIHLHLGLKVQVPPVQQRLAGQGRGAGGAKDGTLPRRLGGTMRGLCLAEAAGRPAAVRGIPQLPAHPPPKLARCNCWPSSLPALLLPLLVLLMPTEASQRSWCASCLTLHGPTSHASSSSTKWTRFAGRLGQEGRRPCIWLVGMALDSWTGASCRVHACQGPGRASCGQGAL